MSRNIGQLLSFVELLQSKDIDSIRIPVIQRDYAQGRSDLGVEEIRNDFVSSLKLALEENSQLTLDCIYGSIKDKSFIPIDGQQRLTTLFLLHYYISVASKKLNSEMLGKFTYMVRDSAKEFCESLVTQDLDLSSQCPSLSIKNSLWYHGGVFDNDPTIIGMLKMLDEIHDKFGVRDAQEYYEKLFQKKSVIKFWWLSIDNFGFADDLFIKMNARGKLLTRFEMFKSEFETVISKSANSDILHEWKEKIDNGWLEFFWNYFGDSAPDNAENGLFRFIIFLGETFYSWQKKTAFMPKRFMEDVNRIQYRNSIESFQDEKHFNFLCKTLDSLEQIFNSDDFFGINGYFRSLVSGENLDYWKYAKIFSVISFSVKLGFTQNISSFNRVLNNLIAYQREVNKRDMIFNTAIDNASYNSFTKGIEDLLIYIKECDGDVIKALQTVQGIMGLSGLSNEIIKAEYILKNGDKEIVDLENIPGMCGLIHNFVDSDKVLITAEKIKKIVSNKRVFIQLLQSYNLNEMLYLRVGYLWPFELGDSSKSFRKHRIWFNDGENGDFMLTSGPGDTKRWQPSLKKLIIDLSAMTVNDIEAGMIELLKTRVSYIRYSQWFHYLIKYPEFFYSDEYSCCMIPEYNNETGYYCLISDRNWIEYYNPFCKALANKLNVPCDASGDVLNILNLPNNYTAEISREGNWIITHDGSIEVLDVSEGQDCIQIAYNFFVSRI